MSYLERKEQGLGSVSSLPLSQTNHLETATATTTISSNNNSNVNHRGYQDYHAKAARPSKYIAGTSHALNISPEAVVEPEPEDWSNPSCSSSPGHRETCLDDGVDAPDLQIVHNDCELDNAYGTHDVHCPRGGDGGLIQGGSVSVQDVQKVLSLDTNCVTTWIQSASLQQEQDTATTATTYSDDKSLIAALIKSRTKTNQNTTKRLITLANKVDSDSRSTNKRLQKLEVSVGQLLKAKRKLPNISSFNRDRVTYTQEGNYSSEVIGGLLRKYLPRREADFYFQNSEFCASERIMSPVEEVSEESEQETNDEKKAAAGGGKVDGDNKKEGNNNKEGDEIEEDIEQVLDSILENMDDEEKMSFGISEEDDNDDNKCQLASWGYNPRTDESLDPLLAHCLGKLMDEMKRKCDATVKKQLKLQKKAYDEEMKEIKHQIGQLKKLHERKKRRLH